MKLVVFHNQCEAAEIISWNQKTLKYKCYNDVNGHHFHFLIRPFCVKK